MTPDQQSALESVVGRPLSTEEIAALAPFLAVRNDVQIAAILSVGRVRLVENMVTERGVLAALGPVEGDALLTALENLGAPETLPTAAQPYHGAICRGVSWLKAGGLDMGSPTVRGLLDLMSAHSIIAPGHAAALKQLGEHPDPIHYDAISDALNVAEGRLTLGG